MKKFILILLLGTASLAQAEIYKCKLPSAEILYQAEPCPSIAVNQSVIQIQDVNPQILAAAQAKYKAWDKKYVVQEKAQQEVDVQASNNRLKAEMEKAVIDEINNQELELKAIDYQQQQWMGLNYYPYYYW